MTHSKRQATNQSIPQGGAVPPSHAVTYHERLATLAHYEILDTPPEPDFDDIVTVAATLCDAPVALISLVDADRQWFKARTGFDRIETPLDESVCAHVVSERDAVEIGDLRADSRTENNPLVNAADGIRYYAGEPLVAPDGSVLGSLCVIDRKPRPDGLTERQRAGLAALGRQTMRLIEARRLIVRQSNQLALQRRKGAEAAARARELEAAQRDIDHRYEVIQQASAAGRVGTFEIDVFDNVLYPSPVLCRLMGLPVADSYAFQVISSLILPDDRARISSLATRRLGTADLSVEFRIRTADRNELRWLARDAVFVCGADGTVLRMIGTVQDITAEKEADARLKALVALGDLLREAQSVDDALRSAGALLGQTLAVSRAGFASFDRRADEITIVHDWERAGNESWVGKHLAAPFQETLALMQRGEVLKVDTVDRRSVGAQAGPFREAGINAFLIAPIDVRGVAGSAMFVFQDKARRWTDDEVAFIEAVADRVQVATEVLREYERRDTVAREIAHRLKNTLAVVQALAKQTLRGIPDKELVLVFERRLLALASAHDVLFERDWRGASLDGLVRQVVERLGMAGRVLIEGPDFSLGPDASTGLSLVLHELTTNALKYGALSSLTGKVTVHWHIVADEGLLHLHWAETGGPPVSAPTRAGLGSRLIRAGLGGSSQTEVTYLPEGVQACFRILLDEVTP